jgi:small subunit ribosomal protein S13
LKASNLPRDKQVEVGLTYIHGIGRPSARQILALTGVEPARRIKDLTEEEVTALRDYIGQNLTVEGDLRRETQMNIKRLIDIGCYRGLRHRRNLPRRGHLPGREPARPKTVAGAVGAVRRRKVIRAGSERASGRRARSFHRS